mmetsp:Transcript_23334/g.41441  ORF Transcript_23334/g.41441 Transcript_23334/m.41441 type:complete len:227 (-) Transcript_23334:3-683(-)
MGIAFFTFSNDAICARRWMRKGEGVEGEEERAFLLLLFLLLLLLLSLLLLLLLLAPSLFGPPSSPSLPPSPLPLAPTKEGRGRVQNKSISPWRFGASTTRTATPTASPSSPSCSGSTTTSLTKPVPYSRLTNSCESKARYGKPKRCSAMSRTSCAVRAEPSPSTYSSSDDSASASRSLGRVVRRRKDTRTFSTWGSVTNALMTGGLFSNFALSFPSFFLASSAFLP